MQIIKNKIFTAFLQGIKSRIAHSLPLLTLLLMLTFGAGKAMAQTYNGGVWYSAKPSNFSINTIGDKEFGVYPPSSGSITFTYQYKKADWTGWFPNFDVKIYCYVGKYGSAINACSGTSFKTYSPKTVSGLDSEATKIKFDRPTGNTHNMTFSDVKLPMAKHIRLKSTTNANGVTDQTLAAFSNTTWGTTNASTKTVQFRSFLTNGNIRITCDKPEIFRLGSADNTDGLTYSVGANAFAYESGSGACSSGHAGATSQYNFKVYFRPAEAKDYSATITITDGTSTATVHVSGKGIKRDQTINDFTTVKTKTTDTFDFNAYTTDNTSGAANGLTVTYSSNNTSVATINATTGQVTIVKDGTVTFTASQAGDASYNSTSKTVTWTISKVTPMVTWPEIESGLKYNESCAIGDKVSAHWTGGSAKDDKDNPVGGTFVCDEELLPSKNSTGYIVVFNPTNTNWYNSTSTNLKESVAKADQTITWNLVEHKEYETSTLMDATATSNVDGLVVRYESNHPEWGYIDAENKLQVVVPNKEIIITAYQDGNANWNAAEPVSKTFTTCGSKPNNWDVSATSLVYGQSLVESSLSGVVKLNETPIEGTLAWVNPAIVPNAGEHSYAVEFTPDNQTANSKVTFDVSVTTERANPVLTWNIGTSLRADSKYSNFVVSTNKENTLTITTSSNLSYADNVLTTGPVAKNTTQSGWITVSQEATTNYYALPDTTVNVTILPRVDVCLPIITMDESVFNEAKVGTKDNVAWCNTNEQGFHDNYILNIDVYYSQKQGIALGKYTEGLDGMWDAITAWLSDNSYDFKYTNKYVDLSFTGVPDSIYFEASSQQVRSVGWIWWIGCWCNKDLTVDWPATAQKWKLYESPDGSTYTQVGELLEGNSVTFKRALKPNTRYVRIEYNGNFTGFIQNLQISQKKYVRTKNGVSEKTFGTEANPLQEPQTVTIQYSSLGDCENKNTAISVSTNNNAFYVDETSITDNVGLDQMGEYTIRVRCNDVNKEGKLIFTAFDGTTAEVTLNSTTPPITSAETTIFQTGTEHAPETSTLYRTLRTHDFSTCFNGAYPRFDTLYIYGVSASSVSNRQFVSVAGKDYKVPVVTASNVLTPCFVYRKNGTQYTYVRTYDAATTTLNTFDADKALGFVGYKPANTSSAIPAIQLNSSATLYLGDAEIIAGGAALKVNNTTATIYSRGENKLVANNSAASIQLASNASLTIRDRWIGSESPRLDLVPASGKPSVDLSANSTFIISGSQVELHNAALNISGHNVNMAIANMSGADKTTGSVLISDGTITSDDGFVLGMPLNTIINGGTFNDIENVVTFDRKGRTIRPKNSRNELLALTEKTRGQLPDWYGKTYLIEVAGKVFPMLEDESICKFMATTDQYSNHNSNWTSVPNNTTDVLISRNMEVEGTLEVKSFTINPDVKVTVKEGATLKVGDYDSFWENTGSLQIAKGGKVELTEGVVSVKDLTIEASLGSTVNNLTTPASSGEVIEENLLDVNGDVYFKLELDPSGRNTYGWYDFVVPFEVDVIGGISIAEAPGARMVFNGNYAIMAFDERRRAETGKGWSKFTGTMLPGQVYTITLDETQPWNTVVFKKKIGASLAGERSITSSYSNDVGEEKDRGWNGYGNATLHHTKLNAPGVSLIQVYDHTNRCYQPREIAAYKIAVGMSFFMQVDDKTVVALDEVQSGSKGGGGYLAPARESKEVETFRLSLTKEGQNYASDLLWVSASEEATGEYVIGHDLAKMGDLTSSKVARMWAKNNNIDLCDIEMPLVYGQASCELNMYVPEQATYSLAVEEAPEDADLFLTYNGKVIWNLTSSPAEIVLNSGLKTDFGLILKSHNAPEIAEGVDNIDDDNHSVRKVLIDNTIYVITPDGAMYDVTGKLIR